MELNRTMLGQMITFAIFIWFTMRFVWPVLAVVLDERRKKISDGLAAAEKGTMALVEAEKQIDEKMKEIRRQSHELLSNAHKTASEIIEEARLVAEKEKDKIVAMGQEQLTKSLQQARVALQQELALLVVEGAKQLLSREIKQSDHNKMLRDLTGKLQ